MSRKRSAFRRIFESESEPQRHVVLVRKARLSSPANHVILRTSPSCPGQAPGIFVIATIAESQRPVLAALKMGDGPYYTFVRRYHLCALEIPNTIRRAMEGQPPLLHNSAAPTIGVAAVAKRSLRPGEHIDTGIGSFQMRGTAVRFRDEPSHLPIGLLLWRHCDASGRAGPDALARRRGFARQLRAGHHLGAHSRRARLKKRSAIHWLFLLPGSVSPSRP